MVTASTAYGFDAIGGQPHYPDRMNFRVWNNTATASKPLGVKMLGRTDNPFQGVGAGTIVVSRDHPLADRIMQADYDVIPITSEVQGVRWSGRVKEFVCEGIPGREIVTATLVDDRAVLHSILGRPNPWSGLELQAPKEDVREGRIDEVILNFVAANSIRTDLPIYIRRPDKTVPDSQVPRIRRFSRMTPLDELFASALEEHNWGIDVRLWVHGDPDPGPVVAARELSGSPFSELSKVSNFMEVHRHRGTGLGLANPGDAGRISEPGLVVTVRPLRDRRFVRWSTQGGGIIHYKITGRHPDAHTSVVGGKSPAWVNDMIQIGVDVGISGLLAAAGITLGSALGPLGALLGGIVGFVGGRIVDGLSDTMLAYSERTDVEMKASMGPFAFPEVFTSSGAGMFSLDAVEAQATGLAKARGGRAIEIQVADSKPHRYGDDLHLPDGRVHRGYESGDLCTFEDRGSEFVDHISSVQVVEDPKGLRIVPTIGHQRIAEDPQVRQIRELKSLLTTGRAQALTTN